MKPVLQLKLSQSLTLTPQLQQAIKLLQMSTLEMEQEIERVLLENPLLERNEDSEFPVTANSEFNSPLSASATSAESTAADEQSQLPESPADVEDDRWLQDAGSFSGAGRDEEDDRDAQDTHAGTVSLREHLSWQLGLTQLNERDRSLVRFLIEALNDDGYLSAPLEELLDSLPRDYAIELQELEIALRQLQNFDPPGIGARDLRECLLLQLKDRSGDPACALAQEIADQHLDVLAARDFARLRRLTRQKDEAIKAAQTLIVSLNPRPGAAYASLEARYILPDVVVKKLKGQWVAYTNPDAFPRLRINRLYADILAKQRRGDGKLSGQLQEARWMIKNVQQRYDTILRVSQTIVERQRQFFEHGEIAMRPLILREIAEELDLHESTISRVTNQKYMATPRGIFELKYFFGSHVATEAGGACSSTATRALIKQLISNESSKKPLSDSKISEILGQQGIVVARRTVAKYRESLNIPPTNLRKTL
ncbi:RNA polymerase factor sigma-54 [Azonexus sp.]|uniref:RNA polymerase factor sigma-54 n=1 Tax=Azonexus sp. TaxID=1872668 RepID=UPI0039E3210C